jgi:hypothetical protein
MLRTVEVLKQRLMEEVSVIPERNGLAKNGKPWAGCEQHLRISGRRLSGVLFKI